MAIARTAEGPLKAAEAVEALGIEAMRRLGHVPLRQGALQAGERVGTELQGQDPTVRRRKKNAEVGVGLRVGGGAGSGLAPPNPELRTAFS